MRRHIQLLVISHTRSLLMLENPSSDLKCDQRDCIESTSYPQINMDSCHTTAYWVTNWLIQRAKKLKNGRVQQWNRHQLVISSTPSGNMSPKTGIHTAIIDQKLTNSTSNNNKLLAAPMLNTRKLESPGAFIFLPFSNQKFLLPMLPM